MKRRNRIGIALVLVLMLMAVSASAVGAGPRSPFVGRWQTNDPAPPAGDGSTNTLTITPRGRSAFNLRWRETFFSLCSGAPGIGRGTGSETAPNFLDTNFNFYCTGTLAANFDIEITYDPSTDTIETIPIGAGFPQTWNRIAGPPGP